MAVIIGSLALKCHLNSLITKSVIDRTNNGVRIKNHPFYRYDKILGDIDVMCTLNEAKTLAKKLNCFAFYPLSESKWVGKYKDPLAKNGISHVEFEIVWEGENTSSNQFYDYSKHFGRPYDWIVDNTVIAPIEVLYSLKMSHRYLKNSPFFEKTRKDIEFIRDIWYPDKSYMDIFHTNIDLWTMLIRREEETYNYSHPKLNVKKDSFFVDEYTNAVDHDWLHEIVAIGDRPAYLEFKDPSSDVWCSKELWDKQSNQVKINAVIEESTVLALERSQIPFEFKPNPEWSYIFALQKVCTSITSGWFREFAWENYFTAKAQMIPGYTNLVKPYLQPKGEFAL